LIVTGSPPAALAVPTYRPRRPFKAQPPRPASRRRVPLVAMAVIAATALQASPALARKDKPLPGFEATMPVITQAPPAPDGSIFNASAGYAPLHVGLRARAVGDPLTILLVESTTAAKTVNSNSQTTGGISLTPPATGPLGVDPEKLKASNDSTFKGGGNAAQTSSLAGTLSVTIAEVRPNGTALVRGEKRMLVSQGREWIQFSGIVRLIDIDLENRIPSSRVADAHIEYSGKGALMRSSKQGWLGQFFNMIRPF
jgi:flagellar L-ring protein precursor FlgH